MKLVITIFLMTLVHAYVIAQVGIGTVNPDPNSALEIHSENKGVLIPKTSDIGNIKKTEGSLIYFENDGSFLYCHNNQWHDVSAVMAEYSGDTARLRERFKALEAKEFVGHGTVPVGGIIMWSGQENKIPEGWALCNGSNGTPDLRGRFVVGYDDRSSGYPAHSGNEYHTMEKQGGVKNFKIAANNLPHHWHTGYSYGDDDGKHNHMYKDSYFAEKIDNIGGWNNSHSGHTIGKAESTGQGKISGSRGGLDYDNKAFLTMVRVTDSKGAYNTNGATASREGKHDDWLSSNVHNYHRHSIRTNDTKTTNTTSGSSTTNASIDQRPPYYVVAYIIRVL
ncbi:MAG: phage tail protein [Bacteroidales bacterium]|nr:phage tail protein [Bacteroidales bacterium]